MSTRFVCSEAYGKVLIARCDDLRLVRPRKNASGKEKRLRKGNVMMWSIGHMRGLWRGTGDESTHQILSYGLLFLTFYRFPYTAGPLTSTAPTRPSLTFARSLPTMPYTHRTTGLVPCRRPLIWPTDHIVTFPFLSLFSLPDAFFRGLTNCRSSHRAIGTLPYVSPHTNLVLVLLIVCI